MGNGKAWPELMEFGERRKEVRGRLIDVRAGRGGKAIFRRATEQGNSWAQDSAGFLISELLAESEDAAGVGSVTYKHRGTEQRVHSGRAKAQTTRRSSHSS